MIPPFFPKDNRRMSAGAKADRFQSDSAAYQALKVDMQRVQAENDEMRSRISVIEGERDEYMKRMVDLEDSVAMSDLRASKMQMLKVGAAPLSAAAAADSSSSLRLSRVCLNGALHPLA